MSDATFAAVLDGLAAFVPPPTVFFGGFGEPPAHPHIVDMVAAVKALGCPAELITHGIGEATCMAFALGLLRRR